VNPPEPLPFHSCVHFYLVLSWNLFVLKVECACSNVWCSFTDCSLHLQVDGLNSMPTNWRRAHSQWSQECQAQPHLAQSAMLSVYQRPAVLVAHPSCSPNGEDILWDQTSYLVCSSPLACLLMHSILPAFTHLTQYVS
jgi:hypothetical protein